MTWFVRLVTFIFTLIPLQAHCSSPELVLSQNTEDTASMSSQSIPSSAVAKAILSHGITKIVEQNRQVLNRCMKTRAIKQYERFFLSFALPKVAGSEQIYFVRPSIQPYCNAFYGAHLFQFWLVSSHGKILFHGAADQVDILAQQDNEMPVFEMTTCNALGCRTLLMKFIDNKYLPTQCKEEMFNEKDQQNPQPCKLSEHLN